jgi:hypothetical protein
MDLAPQPAWPSNGGSMPFNLYFFHKFEARNPKQYRMTKIQMIEMLVRPQHRTYGFVLNI